MNAYTSSADIIDDAIINLNTCDTSKTQELCKSEVEILCSETLSLDSSKNNMYCDHYSAVIFSGIQPPIVGRSFPSISACTSESYQEYF